MHLSEMKETTEENLLRQRETQSIIEECFMHKNQYEVLDFFGMGHPHQFHWCQV